MKALCKRVQVFNTQSCQTSDRLLNFTSVHNDGNLVYQANGEDFVSRFYFKKVDLTTLNIGVFPQHKAFMSSHFTLVNKPGFTEGTVFLL